MRLSSIILLFLTAVLYGQDKSDQKNKEIFSIAFIKTMFPNVAMNDANAAIKVYVNELQKNFAVGYAVRSVIFENCDELIKYYNKEDLAIINLSSVDYLTYKSKLSQPLPIIS
jgi:hypothetical protein